MIRIMIVEDDINIAKGIETIIKEKHHGVEVKITGYSAKALKYARKEKFDMFLLDIELLDYSGIELAKKLRNIDQYKLTPIVFITSIPTEELLAFKKIHCYDYIVKPFEKEDLLITVDTLLNYGIKAEIKEKYVTFDLKDFSYRVKLNDLIYLESIQRKIKAVTISEDILLTGYKLYSIKDKLNDSFIQCHKSFIVNSNYISKVDKANELIELRDTDMQIPIGRKYKENLRSVIDDHN